MIISIIPDREKVRSMMDLIGVRKEFIASVNTEKFPTIAVENYYEIIKELATAILLLEGLKAVGEYAHKETIEALSKCRGVEESEIRLMDDLRIKRNNSSYEGKQISPTYLENKKDKIMAIIEKLEKILRDKIE